MKQILLLLTLAGGWLLTGCNQPPAAGKVWSGEKAAQWYAAQGWLRGCDFIPSTAVNQLEMWQEATFDTTTISRELGYAAAIGFNSVRVYLHHVPWVTDAAGFRSRIGAYLSIAHRYGISTLFVFFDDCWNREYSAGPQPAPRPGVHNSGWVQDPGDAIHRNITLTDTLERYVKDILTHFGHDKRVLLWDLYNEPGNEGHREKSLPLLKKVFRWAREINPDQPVSAGLWSWNLTELNRFQAENSDVITYHNYDKPEQHRQIIDTLRKLGRPLICTEYMARTNGSRFDNIMPMLKKENIGAYNWGLVSGKTNTIYAWSTPMPDGKEPPLWFHDIFRKDGTPYKEEEVQLIRELTGKR
ncbi:cellulase family glycosylhydrolase [Chitinophaga sp. Mgbs1]|uniref:Cellulase family glycosylhydrolase n=1 Tax=Chitinophaga solisilvae TaxID=1233460 RepID=A0A3S1JCB3_9BACT|nr:cellulase family glycosylhydrolase [Chitinophaga solisilvae]